MQEDRETRTVSAGSPTTSPSSQGPTIETPPLTSMQEKIKELQSIVHQIESNRPKTKTKIWRVTAESTCGRQPELSGKEIFEHAGPLILEMFKWKGFNEERFQKRSFTFQSDLSLEINRVDRRLACKITKNGSTYLYNIMILPPMTYRLVLNGANSQNRAALDNLRIKAWATSASYPSEQERKEKKRMSVALFFPTHKRSVPPKEVVIMFATPLLAQIGIYARWSVPEICGRCGCCGHIVDCCPFDDSEPEAQEIFALTTQYEEYHQKQMTFAAKRAITRIMRAGPQGPFPPSPTLVPGAPAPSNESPNPSTMPQSDPVSGAPSDESRSQFSSFINHQPINQPNINNSTSTVTPQSSASIPEALTQRISDLFQRSKPQVIDPEARRRNLDATKQKIIEKATEQVWKSLLVDTRSKNLNQTQQNQPRTSVPSSNVAQTSSSSSSHFQTQPGGVHEVVSQ